MHPSHWLALGCLLAAPALLGSNCAAPCGYATTRACETACACGQGACRVKISDTEWVVTDNQRQCELELDLCGRPLRDDAQCGELAEDLVCTDGGDGPAVELSSTCHAL